MRRFTGIAVSLALVFAFVSCSKVEPPNPELCQNPTAEEADLIAPYIPIDMSVIALRRVDGNPSWVFVALEDSDNYMINLMVFSIEDNKVTRKYEMGKTIGEDIAFGLFLDNDWWASVPFGDEIVCPVVFYYGGTSWVNSFAKFLTVSPDGLSELDVKQEPWTVAVDLVTEKDEVVIRVLDARYEMFSSLCHACAPARMFFFGKRGSEFVNVTSEYTDYADKQVVSAMLAYKNREQGEGQFRIGDALQAYLYAESAGLSEKYYQEIYDMLDPTAFEGDEAVAAEARNLVNEAYSRGIQTIELRGFEDPTGKDIRWNKINWDVWEFEQ
ncbi:MAG TPA: hypothetical protein PKV16_08695 [Caldisericia bacterium]|nr:hypothetical protein [Caldisericia bacterium]HPF49609.1 hypothetical protein [Caldisericia bacterium]HPI84475.1 hypothetical protein [Caldisericia bacterium]HPQ93841.1 hypothetical protein [Caldisericia bacterium]HRV75386.1 hypothetical protein [Caldisericia bacterium]